ncbi:unnamed protein product [Cylindrotheca closterium]|uniref:Uncharacterized protein n=1 Tax=Cylindrotheca closterium TaxID=2856 RepID=A0AAD2CPC5_9STRA|nr:unnamed protein product [Cylindrotheca closterium]
MDQQLRGTLRQRPESSATQIQALVRGFLCRKDSFFIEISRPSLQRHASHVSALTVEGFSTRSLMSYQDDLAEEHPGFEAGTNQEVEFSSPVRKPRRIASQESTGSSLFPYNKNAMRTVDEDDEHPGFDSPNSDEEPVKRPTRLLSKESVDSRGCFLDEGDLLFSPKTVDAACGPTNDNDKDNNNNNNNKRRTKKLSKKMMHIQDMPFARGQRALNRQRPKDRPAVLPIRHRSDTSNDLQ